MIQSIYYNKIIDVEGYSYFVALNKVEHAFIKIATAGLDKKTYIYNANLIVATSNLLSNLVKLETILEFTPFVKGNDSKRKNYYKESKKDKSNGYSKVEKFGIIHFD
jgi:hypothetical protein